MKKLKQAFTLIEMLVVIAIIAILSSLLTPMVNGALDRAKSTKCQSNLRQIGTGLLSYAADHGGRYPPYTINSNYAQTVLPGYTLRWSDEHLLGQYIANNRTAGQANAGSILDCPASDPARKPSNGNIYSTYGMNCRLYPLGTKWGTQHFYPDFPLPMYIHSNPDKTIFAIDAVEARWVAGWGDKPTAYSVEEPHFGNWNAGSPLSNYNWVRRHNKKTTGNMVFLDGHVRGTKDLTYEIQEEIVYIK